MFANTAPTSSSSFPASNTSASSASRGGPANVARSLPRPATSASPVASKSVARSAWSWTPRRRNQNLKEIHHLLRIRLLVMPGKTGVSSTAVEYSSRTRTFSTSTGSTITVSQWRASTKEVTKGLSGTTCVKSATAMSCGIARQYASM